MAKKAKDILFRISNKGCHECISHKPAKDGYPRMARWINGKKIGPTMHRWVYMQAHGSISSDLVVRHKCDNRLCINLLHLETGTLADNCRDRHLRGRTSRVARTNGEINGMCKLKEHQVRYILKNHHKFTQNILAKKFGMSQIGISQIVTRKTWRHLKGVA